MGCRLPSWVPRVMTRSDFCEAAFYQTHPFVALMMWVQILAIGWDWMAGNWAGLLNAAVLVWLAGLERRRARAFDALWAYRRGRWTEDGR